MWVKIVNNESVCENYENLVCVKNCLYSIEFVIWMVKYCMNGKINLSFG